MNMTGDGGRRQSHEVLTVSPIESTWPSFEAFYVGERTRCAQLAWLLTHDRDRVDDLVQEAFTAVFDRFDQLDRPSAYVTTTLVNLVRENARRTERAERRARLVHPRGQALAAEDSPDPMGDAISRLPDKERAAIVLRYWADLPDDEIAECLGVGRVTVRSLVHRAMTRLRTEYRE